MRIDEFEAVLFETEDGDQIILCVGCLPDGVTCSDERVTPIYCDMEFDTPPVCEECGEEHSYMCILQGKCALCEEYTYEESLYDNDLYICTKCKETIPHLTDEEIEAGSYNDNYPGIRPLLVYTQSKSYEIYITESGGIDVTRI